MWIVIIVDGIVCRWHLLRNDGATVDNIINKRRIEHKTEIPGLSYGRDEHVFL